MARRIFRLRFQMRPSISANHHETIRLRHSANNHQTIRLRQSLALRTRVPAIAAAAPAPAPVAVLPPAISSLGGVREFRSAPLEDLGSEAKDDAFNAADPTDDQSNYDFRRILHKIMEKKNPGRNRQSIKKFNKWKKDNIAARRTYLFLLENCRSRKPFKAMTIDEIQDASLALELIKDFVAQFPDDTNLIQKVLKAYDDFYLYISQLTPYQDFLDIANNYNVGTRRDNVGAQEGQEAKEDQEGHEAQEGQEAKEDQEGQEAHEDQEGKQ